MVMIICAFIFSFVRHTFKTRPSSSARGFEIKLAIFINESAFFSKLSYRLKASPYNIFGVAATDKTTSFFEF